MEPPTQRANPMPQHAHGHMWLVGVLDGGCGACRATVSLGRALKQRRIVALDRFDSDYIEGGGRAMLERNLRLAWVPGWAMFAIVNVLAFLPTGKQKWKQLANRAGFRIRDQRHFNGFWFLLLEKPLPAGQAAD